MDNWKHQQDEVNDHTHEPARALFWQARTGKTRTIVKQLAIKKFSRVLVTAPIMALRMSWKKELGALENVSVVDLTQGSTVKRTAAIAEIPKGARVVLLVNIEALTALEPALLKFKAEAIVVDEAHLIKNASAQRTVTLNRLGRKAVWRRILTGTPTPRNYIDLYSQFKFLDPDVFGTSKNVFLDNYCTMHPHWHHQVIGYKNLPDLERRMKTRATRVLRDDCFDIPNILEITRAITLPPSVVEAYRKLVKAQKIEIEGINNQDVTINGTNRLARFTKLQQLTSGFAGSDNGAVWVHREKIAAIVDELSEHVENGEYVVVSYRFRAEGIELENTISKFFGDDAIVERLSGDTPQRDRERITAPFDISARSTGASVRRETSRILIVQEQVGGLGISLAKADHMIVASASADAAAHDQMRDRIWAPSKKITYTYMMVPGTIDYTIKAILERKISAQAALLDAGFEQAAMGNV